MHIDLRRTPPQRPRREQRNRYGSEAAVRSRLLMLVGLFVQGIKIEFQVKQGHLIMRSQQYLNQTKI